jgi:hypothetical protein
MKESLLLLAKATYSMLLVNNHTKTAISTADFGIVRVNNETSSNLGDGYISQGTSQRID